MKEIWKEHPIGVKVSNLGRVWIPKRGTKEQHYTYGTLRPDGYMTVRYKGKNYLVHRLVAECFIHNINNYTEVNHKDEDKTNNRVDNLEWCTREYNMNYGTRIKRIAEKNTNGKLSKPILQYDLNGNFIREWPSTYEIQRQLGFKANNICICLKGIRKTAYEYLWKYKNI